MVPDGVDDDEEEEKEGGDGGGEEEEEREGKVDDGDGDDYGIR